MTRLAVILAALSAVLAGCSTAGGGYSTATPNYDAKFGQAVRTARQAMTINPTAGQKPDPVAGIDGAAARETAIRYHESFKTPPAAVNVINIGGRIGGGQGGGQGQ